MNTSSINSVRLWGWGTFAVLVVLNLIFEGFPITCVHRHPVFSVMPGYVPPVNATPEQRERFLENQRKQDAQMQSQAESTTDPVELLADVLFAFMVISIVLYCAKRWYQSPLLTMDTSVEDCGLSNSISH